MKKKNVLIGISLYTVILYFIISLIVNYITNNDNFITNGKNINEIFAPDLYDLSSETINNYNIDVTFNPIAKTYHAKQITTFVNNHQELLNEIYFHIYPNAFKNKSITPYTLDEFGSLYPNGFDSGYINIKNIKVDGKNVKHEYLNNDTVLYLHLNKPLNKKEKIEILLDYEVKIPNAHGRFGYGKDTINLGNWYPIISVYDENGWNIDPYYKIGDPFYSDVSNYQVTIKAPSDITIASSGNIVSEESIDSNKVWKIEGNLIRDFAWIASENFKLHEKVIDGIKIKSYTIRNDNNVNANALDAAVNSIKIFNESFGKYPYDQFTIVSSNISGAMEYPNIVFINEKFYNSHFIDRLKRIVIHEAAHQWWYSVVGNNQIDEAWLDEGLATFSEYIFHKKFYNDNSDSKFFTTFIENNYISKKSNIENEIILKPIYQFKNRSEYSAIIYKKSAMFLYELEKKYGEKVVIDILKQYYDKYKYMNATTYDFLYLIEEITKDEIIDFSNKWLLDK